MEDERVIKAAINVVMASVLNVLQNDPHQWSTRPCATCRTITDVTGQKFGCYLYAERRANQPLDPDTKKPAQVILPV